MRDLTKRSYRPEIVQFLPDNYTKVLEIGCHEGDFSYNLKKECEIWGVEPNRTAAEYALQKLNKVLIGKYEEIYHELPDAYFDLVICNDVIEHIADHDNFFKSIQNKMTCEGVLIASVPNVRHISNLYGLLVKKDWEYQNNGILDYTHLRFFTEKSLLRTLNSHQFKIEHFTGINSCIKKYALVGDLFSISITLLTSLSILATLGYYWDIQYLQYGFRVKKTTSI